MGDIVDEANRHVQMHLDTAIAAATRPRGPGAEACTECGEEISPFRQLLGATRCIDCQNAKEHKDKIAR